jgi:hypothetical protein
MAVREGFEPSEPFLELGALAKLCFQPLSHLTWSSGNPKLSGVLDKRSNVESSALLKVNNSLFGRFDSL